jgi:hypothetical protein
LSRTYKYQTCGSFLQDIVLLELTSQWDCKQLNGQDFDKAELSDRLRHPRCNQGFSKFCSQGFLSVFFFSSNIVPLLASGTGYLHKYTNQHWSLLHFIARKKKKKNIVYFIFSWSFLFSLLRGHWSLCLENSVFN